LRRHKLDYALPKKTDQKQVAIGRQLEAVNQPANWQISGLIGKRKIPVTGRPATGRTAPWPIKRATDHEDRIVDVWGAITQLLTAPIRRRVLAQATIGLNAHDLNNIRKKEGRIESVSRPVSPSCTRLEPSFFSIQHVESFPVRIHNRHIDDRHANDVPFPRTWTVTMYEDRLAQWVVRNRPTLTQLKIEIAVSLVEYFKISEREASELTGVARNTIAEWLKNPPLLGQYGVREEKQVLARVRSPNGGKDRRRRSYGKKLWPRVTSQYFPRSRK